MSSSLHVFMSTQLAVPEAARQLAAAVDGELIERNGHVYVSGRRDGAEVGGEVLRNIYADPSNAEPDDQSVIDSYNLAYDIRRVPHDEDARLIAGRQIFHDITTRLRWPAILVDNLGTLVTAWNPDLGRTDFPDDTSPDMEDFELWRPYAIPPA